MKNSIIILFGLLLSLGSTQRDTNLFQVVTSHPHELEELAPHIDTVYQNGRLWIVELSPSAPEHVREHLLPLRSGVKSYRYQGLPFLVTTYQSNEEGLDQILNTVSSKAIKADVIHLAGYKTRYLGTEGNTLALNSVADRFRALGFKTQKFCAVPEVCNLIAEKAGASPEVLMVMGHIDSVSEKVAGADDNASGVAVMLEMARVLKDHKNQKTIRFFVSNAEELGLIGSTQYAAHLARIQEIQKISLAINMDMVGYNSNGVVELETDPAREKLARHFADLASRYTSLKTKITLGAWGSDHVPFLKRGVPTILTIEDWNTKSPCYHLPCDTPDTLNYDYAAEIAKLNLAAILYQDTQL